MLVNVEKINFNLDSYPISFMYSKFLNIYSGILNNLYLVCNKSTEGYAPLLGINNLSIRSYSDFEYYFKDINNKLSLNINAEYTNHVDRELPKYLKDVLLSSHYLTNSNLNYDVSSDYQLPIKNSIKTQIKKYLYSSVCNYSSIFNLNRTESISIESLLSSYINLTSVNNINHALIGNGVFLVRCFIDNKSIYIPVIHLEIKKEYVPYYRLAYIMNRPISLKFFKVHVLNLTEDSKLMEYIKNYIGTYRLVKDLKKIINLDWGEVIEHSEEEMREFYGKKFTENIKIPINKQKEFKKAILSNFINAKKNKFVETHPDIFKHICN